MMVKHDPWAEHEINRLCDLVSEDKWSLGKIVNMMGRSKGSVCGQWFRIRKKMGDA